MASKNFTADPGMFPGLIRKNLNAWYRDGYAVVKELLQNADDAGATRLEIGWSPRLDEISGYSLLDGPAIYVVNDGPFTQDDERAIRLFGLGNKPDNPNKIGQFGLGLKSVFHLCEAYIYASESHFPGDNGAPHRKFRAFDICNPWSGITEHPAKGIWDDLPRGADDEIRKYLNPVLPHGLKPDGPSGWLCLWLPLRRKFPHDGDWYFPGEFHGDREGPPIEIFSHVEDSVASMLPMMRHLSSVRVWMPDELGKPRATTMVVLVKGSRCVYSHSRPADPEPLHLCGHIQVTRDGDNHSLSYAGAQQKLFDPELAGLRADADHWPRIEGFHEKTGFCIVRAKNDQHAAAYFTRRPTSGPGSFKVNWAVFLPLSAEKAASHPLSCGEEVTLTLHGWFFVDPGRQWADVFHRSATGSSTVEQQWNIRLAERGTLRLLIPALDKLVTSCRDNDRLPSELTKAIQGSDLFARFGSAICAMQNWGFCLDPEGGRWRAIDSGMAFYEIPAPMDGAPPDVAFRVLPYLSALVTQGLHVVSRDVPRLSVNTATPWTPKQVHELLSSVSVALSVADSSHLAYLVAFLRSLGEPLLKSPAVSAEICRIARAAIQRLAARTNDSLDSAVQNLLSLTPRDARVRVRFSPALIAESRRIARALQECTDLAIIVPEALDPPEAPSCGSLPQEVVGKLLSMLAEMQPQSQQVDEFNTLRSLVAIDLIGAARLADDALHGLIIDIAGLPLFPVTSYRTRTKSCASIDRLLKAHDGGMLFVQVSAMLSELQRCLADADVLYLQQSDVAELIEKVSHRVPISQAASILHALSKRPALGNAQACSDLFAKLAMQVPSHTAESISALRYLLHRSASGDTEAAPGNTTRRLLASDLIADAVDNPWHLVAHALLGVTQSEWRLVSLATLERVPVSLWPTLGVVRLDATSVCSLARESAADTSSRTAIKEQLSLFAARHPQALRKVVVEWPLAGDATQVLRGLPLFTDAAGQLVTITDSTRTPGGFTISDPSVLPTVRFLRVEEEHAAYAARLKQLAPPLTAEDAIRLVLRGTDPSKHHAFITDTLGSNEQLFSTLRDELRTTRWLPSLEGVAVAPVKVVHVPDCAEVEEVVSQKTGRFAVLSQIDAALLERVEALELKAKFVRLLTSGSDAIVVLGEAMRAEPAFHLGLATVTLTELHLETLISVFGDDMAGHMTMPAVPLIAALRSKWATTPDRASALRQHVIAPLQQVLATEQIPAVLNDLATAHENELRAERVKILELFNLYLTEASNLADFKTAVLPKIRLQSNTGTWMPTTELASGTSGPSNRVVSPEHRKLIGSHLSQGGGPPPSDPEPPTGPPPDLGEYMRLEFADCPGAVVGFVMSLLGEGEKWAQLSAELAGPFPLDVVLRSMAWPSVRWFHSWEHARATCRLRILRAKPDMQRVLSITGVWIEVPRCGPLSSLLDGFDGSQYRASTDGCREYDVFVTPVPTLSMSVGEKLALLKGTATSLLVDLYGQSPDVLDEPWRVLTDTGQLSIAVAQRLILESSLFHLRGQLGVRSTPELKSLFHRWDSARTREAVASEFVNSAVHAGSHEAQSLIAADLHALLVGTTPPARHAQTQILSAICERLSATSYDVSSIPFELYQNADDAAAELAWLLAPEDASGMNRELCIVVRDDEIIVCHWGRAINQYRVAGAAGRDGWERGFARDLEKMLVLSSSDKGLESDRSLTTGKFGLGFKSVFFACEEPEVMSGASLHFVVRGGVFPEQLSTQRVAHLREELGAAGDASAEGTAIRLPLKHGVIPKGVIHRFMEVAHVLPCFSKCLKRIRVSVNGRMVAFTWNGAGLAGLSGVTTGMVQPVREFSSAESGPVRLLRLSANNESLLLALGSTGFISAPMQTLPTVWVTAPTSHNEGLGLCVNGQFDLNPGRTQLRHTSDNQSRAELFGKRLGDMLVSLYDASQSDWENIRKEMGLSAAATAKALWESLWTLVVPAVTGRRGHPDVTDLLRRSLVGSRDNGLLKLLHERDTLPTQLSVRFGAPTRWARVRHALNGVLSRDAVLGEVETWPWFREHVQPGEAVHGDIAAVLKHIDPTVAVRPLQLVDVVREQIGPSLRVPPQLADELGGLLDREFLVELGKDSDTARECDAVQTYLRTLQFRDADGDWQLCQNLLAGRKDGDEFKDERLRAEFAPSSRVLSTSYKPLGTLFLLACRGPMRATAEEMANWAVSAEGDGAKMKGVQNYLESGELARQVGVQIQKHPGFAHSWLKRLASDEQLRSDPNRCGAVLSTLGLMQDLSPGSGAISPLRHPAREPGALLTKLYQVWTQRGKELLADYERSVYPGGRQPAWTLEGLTDAEECRAQWLTLFVLGALHTMGRAKHEQHRGFIDLCRSRGWLQRFADPRLDGGQWLSVLDDYLEGQSDSSEYYHWVNQFVPIYQFARWLPEYVELFLAIGRDRNAFNLIDYTRPLTSARLGGGGVSAPPISRTLGIGACFVTRELVRGGLICNTRAHRHCFVPSHRVRRLLVDVLGAPPFDLAHLNRKWEWSCHIYEFLHKHMGERVTFDLAFDIPLLLLANSKPLQQDVFGQHIGAADEANDDDETVLFGDDDPGEDTIVE